ncbi:peptidase inhibitor family I36 protein [Aeromicrobium sp. P5_D10]
MKTSRFITSAATIIAVTGINLAVSTPAEAALSDCPSGYMCVWSGKGYSGTMKKYNSTGAYKSISLNTVDSYYNNRSKRTWLHATSNGSGTYSCLGPGQRNKDLAGWQTSAKAVYLATITDC